MSEKISHRIKDVLTSIFGESSWIVSHWLTQQVDLDAMADLQEAADLTRLLDSFEGKMSIDNPEFLKIINAWAGVEIKGKIPDLSGLNFVIGNYAGREANENGEPAFLYPTLWSLFKFFEVALEESEGKIFAVARDSVFEGVDERVQAATEKHMLYAVKKDGGKYQLKSRWGKLNLMRMVHSRKGVLWTAPAASTEMGGLPLEGMTTTSVRQAMEIEEAKLLTLAMETDQTGEKAKSIRLDEVDLPSVEQIDQSLSSSEYKALLREIYFQVLLFSFAQVAGFIPEEQRGQFPDPELAQKRVVRNLHGVNHEGLVRIKGGFMS